jgi:fumarate hydratase class II
MTGPLLERLAAANPVCTQPNLTDIQASREQERSPTIEGKRMEKEFRLEHDSMGEMTVPAQAYYGAQTARAVENFPISNLRFSRPFIRTLGLIKKHAARTNQELGQLSKGISAAIERAADEVMAGEFDDQFVVDIFQTGSGTSTNMNANEVIANRAIEILGGKRGDRSVHPNDHVNRGQSSNDVIPTAIHIAALEGIHQRLIPALQRLNAALSSKVSEFNNIIKIGRTHLQDATPIRLGQEFSGYASQVEHAIQRLRNVEPFLGELALGGTAVGTGINTHQEFAPRTIAGMATETGLPLREAPNHFEGQGAIDACVETSGALKSTAVSLIKIANDIRWLGSGPRCGLGELRLPATQPGSSIMPGKVNPVMCEMVIQVGAQVIGNDAVITFGGTYGAFELNTMLPVVAYNLLQAIELLANACRVFTDRCVSGLQADAQKCEANVEQSLALCTALAPVIGYDKAARIAKTAFESGRTVREVAAELSGLEPAALERLLDPKTQTEPDKSSH